MHIKYEGQYASDQFISIVICSYKRLDFTQALVESIHEHADMPFEIILHDDGSDENTPDMLYQMRDRVSSLIVSGGSTNMGLSAALERGTSLASSDYILCLNNDMLMIGPGLRDIPKVLSNPYVGVFGPWQIGSGNLSPNHITIDSNGQRFYIGNLSGAGACMSFRRDMWHEIGGFPLTFNGAADTAFMRKVSKHGFHNAVALTRDAEMFDNPDYRNGCARSTLVGGARNLAYPRLFNASNLEQGCKNNELAKCGDTSIGEDTPGSIFNNDWWHYYFADNIIAEENNYRWENLTYHSRFKDLVERDRAKV